MLPSEYHFCTYFDRNYLTRGLVLYRSLVRHCRQPFTLWVLCFDAITYQILDRLSLPGIRLIALEQFEFGDSNLQQVKAERSLVEYFWTCTPLLLLYILRYYPEVEFITYLDADLCFYADPMPVYSEMGDGSILIVEHRYAPEHEHFAENTGIYNVGLLAFHRDDRGLACLHWWRDRCLEWCYLRIENGKFGDQKYLDDWPQRFEGVVVLKHLGAGLAPWNISKYNIGWQDGLLYVDGAPLIFYHFHGLKNMTRNVIQPVAYGYRLSSLLIEHLYYSYAHALREAERDAGVTPNVELRQRTIVWLSLLPNLLVQRWLLVGPQRPSLVLWRVGEWAHNYLLAGISAYRRGKMRNARRP
jgi:hypothetical protein